MRQIGRAGRPVTSESISPVVNGLYECTSINTVIGVAGHSCNGGMIPRSIARSVAKAPSQKVHELLDFNRVRFV
jgi:hypothetical protein